MPCAEGAPRVNIILTQKSNDAFEDLRKRTNLNKTDIVNRAIQLLQFVESLSDDNRELIIRDRNTDNQYIVQFM